MTSSDCFFCPTSRSKPKDSSFSVVNNKAKKQIEIGMEGKTIPAYFKFLSKYLFVFMVFVIIVLGFIYGGIG